MLLSQRSLLLLGKLLSRLCMLLMQLLPLKLSLVLLPPMPLLLSTLILPTHLRLIHYLHLQRLCPWLVLSHSFALRSLHAFCFLLRLLPRRFH